MIDDTVRWIISMQPKHEDPIADPMRFERDFEREFGVGDEQQIAPRRTDQDMFDAGMSFEDF